MNVDELAHCALDPETRILKKMTMNDGSAASKMFNVLMGNDVASRKAYLIENSSVMDPEALDI